MDSVWLISCGICAQCVDGVRVRATPSAAPTNPIPASRQPVSRHRHGEADAIYRAEQGASAVGWLHVQMGWC
jgi:hypothetical protein